MPAAAPVPDSERHHRRRDRSEHQCDGKALGGKDFRCGERELLGAVPGVTADHDMRSAQAPVLEHLGDRPGGAQDDGEVHPVRSAAQGPAQARRPERQRLGEPLVEFVVAAARQLGGGLRIGIVRDPLLRGRRGPRRSHTASVPTFASAYASLRSTGATSISRSNSSGERLSRMVACNHASRSARSASSSAVPASVISMS